MLMYENSPIKTPMRNPTKADDSEYSYEFECWEGYHEGMIATKNQSFKAVFLKKNHTQTEDKKCNISFWADGLIFKEYTLDKGETIKIPQEIPVRKIKTIYTSFVRWLGYKENMIAESDQRFIAYFDKPKIERTTDTFPITITPLGTTCDKSEINKQSVDEQQEIIQNIDRYNEFFNEILNEDLQTALSRYESKEYDISSIPMAYFDGSCLKMLKLCNDLGNQSFLELGKMVKGSANNGANLKYGELRAKILSYIGAVEIVNRGHRGVQITGMGKALLTRDETEAIRIMKRLSLSIPIVYKIIKEAQIKDVLIGDYFDKNTTSATTILRRSSSIYHIISDVISEYGNESEFRNIHLKPPSSKTQNESVEIHADEEYKLQPEEESKITPITDEKEILIFEKLIDYIKNNKQNCVGIESLIVSFPRNTHQTLPFDVKIIKTEDQGVVSLKNIEKWTIISIMDGMNILGIVGIYKDGTNTIIVGNETHIQNQYLNPIELGGLKIYAVDDDCSNVASFYVQLSRSLNKTFQMSSEKIRGLLETLIFIIEDPSSELISQTICNIAIGFFIKYVDNSKTTLDYFEYVASSALDCIYAYNQDLVMDNLSPKLDASSFYDCIDKKDVILKNDDRKKIDSIINLNRMMKRMAPPTGAPTNDYSEKMSLYRKNQAVLFHKSKNVDEDTLEQDEYMEMMGLIYESRLECPKNGLKKIYKPLELIDSLSQNDLEEKPIRSILVDFANERMGKSFKLFEKMWIKDNDFWQDYITELVTLSYLLSPFCIPHDDLEDIAFIIVQSQIDEVQSTGDAVFIDEYKQSWEKIADQLDFMDEIRILSRVNHNYVTATVSSYGESLNEYIESNQREMIHLNNVIISKKTGTSKWYRTHDLIKTLEIEDAIEVNNLVKRTMETDGLISRNNRTLNRINRIDLDDDFYEEF